MRTLSRWAQYYFATACVLNIHPWSNDDLFNHSRLINVALMAKIPHSRVDSSYHQSSHLRVAMQSALVGTRQLKQI